jgi:SMC interacting uncharacterized protein involved in chromosome segregation
MCVFLRLQIYLAEMKVAETKEKQKEFEKSSTELLEKLTKITQKREERENEAKEMAAEMDKVSHSIQLSNPQATWH